MIYCAIEKKSLNNDKSIIEKVIAFWFFLYAVLSNPFLLSSYIPFYLRFVLEIGLLYLLVGYFIASNRLKLPYVLTVIWTMLFILTLLGVDGPVNPLISTSLKIIILILLVRVAHASVSFREMLRCYWIFIWSLASVSVILIYFSATFDILTFTQFDFGDVNELAPYTYYGNLLGYFIPYHFFDLFVPKINWYLFEPIYLSFFLGLNVVVADEICSGNKKSKRFRILNMIAGFLTFSTSYFIFLFIYLVFQVLKLRFFRRTLVFIIPLAIVAISFVLYLFFFDSDVATFTSLSDRTDRLDIAAQAFSGNSIFSFLFGNGIGFVPSDADRGISSGILTILVERGLLVFVFITYLFYEILKPNWPVLLFLIYYNMTFESVWLPVLFMLCAVLSVNSKTKNSSLARFSKTTDTR